MPLNTFLLYERHSLGFAYSSDLKAMFLFRFPKLECSIAVMFFGLVVDVIFDVGVLFCGRDIEIAVMFPSQTIIE